MMMMIKKPVKVNNVSIIAANTVSFVNASVKPNNDNNQCQYKPGIDGNISWCLSSSYLFILLHTSSIKHCCGVLVVLVLILLVKIFINSLIIFIISSII